MTRPEPTIYWQLRWLGLHCRQKAQRVQDRKSPKRVVAVQQQGFYTQLINNLNAQRSGQLVGDLWTDCELCHSVPHRGLQTHRYTCNRQSKAGILSKNSIRVSKKLAFANLNAVQHAAKKLSNQGRPSVPGPKKSPKPESGQGLLDFGGTRGPPLPD